MATRTVRAGVGSSCAHDARPELFLAAQQGALGAQTLPPREAAPATRHLPELDALRGAAALVVLLNHGQQTWIAAGAPSWIAHPRHNPLVYLLVNGHASVILFFLLSGFVLTLPQLRERAQPYPQFILRRFLRIYPPFFVALAVALVGCSLMAGAPSYGNALSIFWPRTPDLPTVLQHVLLLGRFDVYRYDGPVWSLVHEARMSLLFPVVALLTRRLRSAAVLAVAAGCAVLSSFSLYYLETSPSGPVRLTAWSLTLSYFGIFLLGSALARHRAVCLDLLDRLPKAARALLFVSALLMYLYPRASWRMIDLDDLWVACAGVVLLAFCLRRQGLPARLLRMRAMQWLGKLSYSLYLIHVPVLLLLCSLLYRRLSLGWVLVAYLATSLVGATVLHRLVEVPCITIGRRVGRMDLAAWMPARRWAEMHPQRPWASLLRKAGTVQPLPRVSFDR